MVKALLAKFGSGLDPRRQVGVRFTGGGVHLVLMEGLDGDKPQCTLAGFFPEASAVGEWVSSHGLSGLPCSITLSADDYQLLTVDKPAVADEELHDAVRWKIKDMLEMGVNDAVIDSCPVPNPGERHKDPMLFVIAAGRGQLAAKVDQVTQAGLQPWNIDIGELAARNVTERLAPDVTVGLVLLGSPRSSIQIMRDDELFLSRSVDFDAEAAASSEFPDAETFDGLTLNVQRTMDYYDSNVGGPPVKRILIAPAEGAHPAMLSALGVGLGIPVEALELKRLAPDYEQADPLALGGALRRPESLS